MKQCRGMTRVLSGAIAIGFGALLPWLDRANGGFIAFGTPIPIAVPLLLLAFVFVASCWSAWDAIGWLRGGDRRVALLVCALVAIWGAGAAGTWYGYFLDRKLHAYEFRPYARSALLFLGSLLIASALDGSRLARFWRRIPLLARRFGTTRSLLIMSLTVVIGSAAIGKLILDGIPHMSDGLTYLLQGRILWSGRLAVETPRYPELFEHSIFFKVSSAGYFGKYPPGWPLLLGLFDALSAPWLAAPLLAGGLVFATYRLVQREAGRRLGVITALLLAGCPLLWFNAATQMSHVASAFWLILFLNGFCAVRRHPSVALGSWTGLALGAAIATRPQDAVFFSLPIFAIAAAIVWKGDWSAKRSQLAIGVGALVGALVYLGVNRRLMGSAGTSPYGNSIGNQLVFQSPASLIDALSWAHQNWAGLSMEAYAGALPVGVFVMAGLLFARREIGRLPILILCSASLLACYTVFIFTSRPWVGPRWLAPAMPGMAYAIACAVFAAGRAARDRSNRAAPARLFLSVVFVSLMACWLVGVPIRLFRLRSSPPHNVDDRVHQAVARAELRDAVLALPIDDSSRLPNHKDSRAGIWMMRVPFDESPVIFVRAIDDWPAKARASYPGRDLYRMNSEPDDFEIIPVAD